MCSGQTAADDPTADQEGRHVGQEDQKGVDGWAVQAGLAMECSAVAPVVSAVGAGQSTVTLQVSSRGT